MKKVLVVCVAFAASLLFTTNTQAQQIKIGFFDDQQLIPYIPGAVEKVDSSMKRFLTDSLKTEYDILLSDYQYKDSMLKIDTTKGTLSASAKKVRTDAVNELKQKLISWQQYQEEKMRAKQGEFLQPYLERIYAALQDVITEQKYTYIFKPDVLIWGEKSDELALRVLAKLKVPLPKELQERINALIGVPKAPATGVPKPATTPVKH
jgi:Skp family chaperone for outer membrane proteins